MRRRKEHLLGEEIIQPLYATGIYSTDSKIPQGVKSRKKNLSMKTSAEKNLTLIQFFCVSRNLLALHFLEKRRQ